MSATQLTPVRAALHRLHEGIYFIPKEVQDWLTDPANGPIAAFKPWKTKDVGWWVFTCPPGEQEFAHETMGIEVTHLFVPDQFRAQDIRHNRLFRYYSGQFDVKNTRWRYIDPDKSEQDIYQLTTWKEGKWVNAWHDSQQRRRSFWFS